MRTKINTLMYKLLERIGDHLRKDGESLVYDPPRAKRISRWTVAKIVGVMALWFGFLYIPYNWGMLLLIPVVWMACSGAVATRDRAMAFKIGWFTGQVDMTQTLSQHDDIAEGLRLQQLRLVFVQEGLGVDRPNFDEEPDEDGS